MTTNRSIKPHLHSLTLELSERCNLNCVHCYINLSADDKEARNRELPTSFWQSTLIDARRLGCRQIRITGGEPLLRPDFLPIYTFAHKLGFSVFVLTNATLISEQVLRTLLEHPPEQIYISIYGWDQESYERHTRTRGGFHRFLSGVRLLTQACLPVHFRIPPSRDLIACRHLIRRFAFELSPFADVEVGWYLTRRARPDEEKSRKILDYRLSPAEAADIIAETGAISKRDTLLKSPQKLPIKLFACKAGQAMAIDAYGTLQLCIEVRHPSTLFSLREHTLHDALVDHVPNMKALLVTNAKYLNQCAVCKIRWLCYQCPGCSWSENASLDSPVDYLCQVAHCVASKIGLPCEAL